VREFTMKDSYSLDADAEGLDRQYQAHYQAYFRMFRRCGLPVLTVQSDVGMMGGKMAHEYMYLTPVGEDTLILCDSCGYTANRQVARFNKPAAAEEAPAAPRKVATPGMATIEGLANFLNVPKSKTAKAFLAVATVAEGQGDVERFVFAIIRGDMDVNETKLANAVRARDLRPAREDEIRRAGAVPGYASPVGLKHALVIVDDSIPASPNLVAGANEDGYHLLNVNCGRDFQAGIVADIALAAEGHACPECGARLRAARGVEVGNIFKLGTRYSDALGCTFLDRDGKPRPVVMGSYGIGVGRLLACVAEEHHDERGLVWPVTVAPYHAHLVALKGGEDAAERLYTALGESGVEVLYDDRAESPGVKFSDADLIGLPLRLTVSQRSLREGGAELKRRHEAGLAVVPLDDVVSRAQSEIRALESAIAG
jgi:prolyl-tRNA synthetase